MAPWAFFVDVEHYVFCCYLSASWTYYLFSLPPSFSFCSNPSSPPPPQTPQVRVHQQVCFSLWDHASQGGGTPSWPCPVQRRLSWETEELPQHWQLMKRAIGGGLNVRLGQSERTRPPSTPMSEKWVKGGRLTYLDLGMYPPNPLSQEQEPRMNIQAPRAMQPLFLYFLWFLMGSFQKCQVEAFVACSRVKSSWGSFCFQFRVTIWKETSRTVRLLEKRSLSAHFRSGESCKGYPDLTFSHLHQWVLSRNSQTQNLVQNPNILVGFDKCLGTWSAGLVHRKSTSRWVRTLSVPWTIPLWFGFLIWLKLFFIPFSTVSSTPIPDSPRNHLSLWVYLTPSLARQQSSARVWEHTPGGMSGTLCIQHQKVPNGNHFKSRWLRTLQRNLFASWLDPVNVLQVLSEKSRGSELAI